MAVTDPGNFRCQVFTADGTFVKAFGQRGTEPGRFLEPEGIVVDASGTFWVSDNKNDTISRFAADGTYLDRIGGSGSAPGQFREPESLALHNGELFVADEANGRIQVFSAEGRFLREIGRNGLSLSPAGPDQDDPDIAPPSGESLFQRDVEGIVCHPDGRLFAANEDEGIIEIFDASGRRIDRFTSAAPGGFKKIQGLALNPAATRLYVADLGNARIQVFLIP